MKDIYYYAEKNGLILQPSGNCQLCGSTAVRGIFECQENFCAVSERVDFSDPVNHLSRFLAVDAMALQHSEVHGLGSNYLHLTRLYLILEKGIIWTYKKTPILSGIFNTYKKSTYITVRPPPQGDRGKVTSQNVAKAINQSEISPLIRMWAESVFDAYKVHHATVSPLAEEFLKHHY